MRESCFCGRSGELEDREPILDAQGVWVLRCPDCGHLDYLTWLSEEAALLVWGEARRRHEIQRERLRKAGNAGREHPAGGMESSVDNARQDEGGDLGW
jgi:hypothetical protein